MRPLDADGPAHAPRGPALQLDAAAVARLGELMADACRALAADTRADPLPVARLLAECAATLGLECPWCGGSGETGAYVGEGPGPRPDDVPERCPACQGGQE